MASWAAGVSYARILNTHERHGDVLKIATAADFCGTRWQNNAVIIPTPTEATTRRICSRWRASCGCIVTTRAPTPSRWAGRPEGLDVTASRRGDTVYLHVVNTLRTTSVSAAIQIEGQTGRAGRVFEIAGDPMVELSYLNSADAMKTTRRPLAAGGVWEFPAASVSALELTITPPIGAR